MLEKETNYKYNYDTKSRFLKNFINIFFPVKDLWVNQGFALNEISEEFKKIRWIR